MIISWFLTFNTFNVNNITLKSYKNITYGIYEIAYSYTNIHKIKYLQFINLFVAVYFVK